ncbi:hypothetical protein FQA39_LY02292 [Lamprigera yunnana]|nr:hypothetical protein FQA39_LY02292 [Lamprigera yunnana]
MQKGGSCRVAKTLANGIVPAIESRINMPFKWKLPEWFVCQVSELTAVASLAHTLGWHRTYAEYSGHSNQLQWDRMSDEGSQNSSFNEAQSDENSSETINWFEETQWTNIKKRSHKYITTFPKYLKKQSKLDIDLPYPIISSSKRMRIEHSSNVFNHKLSKFNRMDYIRKVHSSTTKTKVSLKDLKKEIITIPKYLLYATSYSYNENTIDVSSYNGGVLDCFKFQKSPYLTYANTPYSINCVKLDDAVLFSKCSLHVDKSSPIYNVQCNVSNNVPVVAVRQQKKISIMNIFNDTPTATTLCEIENKDNLSDTAFNSYNDKDVSVVDRMQNLKVFDFNEDLLISEYSFQEEHNKLCSSSPQILYLDASSLAFINSCCVHVLDLRSMSVKKKCLKSHLSCDELCTLSKQNSHSVYISSMHNVLEFDTRTFQGNNKVMHMMSSRPFLSSSVRQNKDTYYSLFSETDKVLLNSSKKFLSLPQSIPNVKETFKKTCSILKLDDLQSLEERLKSPIIGMKLYNDTTTNDIIILTSNLAGDVFKQKIVSNSELSDSTKIFFEWAASLSPSPKGLEVSNICNLSNVFQGMTTTIPHEKRLKYIMQGNTAQHFVEKNIHTIEDDLKSKVGNVMNSIWEEDDTNITGNEEVPSQSKVIQWLDMQR